MVEAAGGVLWRRVDDRVEVLLIHRPHRDDWSLPKGKRDEGESSLECAEREVLEETGMKCRVGGELPETRYRNRSGREKRVRYWAMRPTSGKFQVNDEVDKVRWVPIEGAAKLLTYERDAVVVEALARDEAAA